MEDRNVKKATIGQLADIMRLFANGDYNREFAQALIEKRIEILDKPCEQTSSPYRGGPSSESSELRAEIIHIQPSYADLKKAFDWVYDGYKNAEFKAIDVCKDVSTENREIEFELVHLDKEMHTDAILAELDRLGFRPALYEELFGFAKQYPDEQRKYPIVALGSVCLSDDHLRSPYVYGDDSGRGLHMYPIDYPYPWHRSYRFLAVRK
jgi:hypothetical protein